MHAALAYETAEQLRAGFEQGDVAHEWQVEPIRFTVSIGMVTIDSAQGSITGIDALMKRADRALYRAKDGGRNRVEVG